MRGKVCSVPGPTKETSQFMYVGYLSSFLLGMLVSTTQLVSIPDFCYPPEIKHGNGQSPNLIDDVPSYKPLVQGFPIATFESQRVANGFHHQELGF